MKKYHVLYLILSLIVPSSLLSQEEQRDYLAEQLVNSYLEAIRNENWRHVVNHYDARTQANLRDALYPLTVHMAKDPKGKEALEKILGTSTPQETKKIDTPTFLGGLFTILADSNPATQQALQAAEGQIVGSIKTYNKSYVIVEIPLPNSPTGATTKGTLIEIIQEGDKPRIHVPYVPPPNQ